MLHAVEALEGLEGCKAAASQGRKVPKNLLSICEGS